MNGDKVWIVLSEIAPSGGFVVGVFDNEADALVIADAYSSTSVESFTVGENQIESGFIDQLRGNKAYWITVNFDGVVIECERCSIMESLSLDALKVRRWVERNPFYLTHNITVQCIAPNEEQAMEVAKAQFQLAVDCGELDALKKPSNNGDTK